MMKEYTFVALVYSGRLYDLYDETVIIKVKASNFGEAERMARRKAVHNTKKYQHVVIDTATIIEA